MTRQVRKSSFFKAASEDGMKRCPLSLALDGWSSICLAALYSLTTFLLLAAFFPGGVFVPVIHWQLDGRANMHDEAHLAAALAVAGREKG